MSKMFPKWYPRYADEENVTEAFKIYCKRKSVVVEEEEVRNNIIELIVRRLEVGKSYELTKEDRNIIKEIDAIFGENCDFENDFLMGVKRINYCLERYDIGKEIKYEEIEKNFERIFEDTMKLTKSIEEYFEHEDWEVSIEKDDVKIFTRKKKDSSFLMIKGSTEFECKWGYEKVGRLTYDFPISGIEPEERVEYKKIDIDNAYAHSIIDFDKDHCVAHLRYASNSLVVYDREFIFTRKFHIDEENKCAYVIGLSPDYFDPDTKNWYPVDKKRAVRAFCTAYSYQAKQLDDGNIRLSYAMHVMPNGWVPGWMYNLKCRNKGFGVLRYRKMIKLMEEKDEDEGESEDDDEEEEGESEDEKEDDDEDDDEEEEEGESEDEKDESEDDDE